MKRVIKLISTALIVTMLFASCGKAEEENTTEAQDATTLEQISENSSQEPTINEETTAIPDTTTTTITVKHTQAKVKEEEAEPPKQIVVTPAVPISDFEKEMLAAVNKERKAVGLNELAINSTVSTGAQLRAKEITESFAHTRPDGSGCFTVLNVDYNYAGENIASGQKDVEQVMESWMNSEGHRANILNPNFTEVGFGCYTKDKTVYWVQIFVNLN